MPEAFGFKYTTVTDKGDYLIRIKCSQKLPHENQWPVLINLPACIDIATDS